MSPSSEHAHRGARDAESPEDRTNAKMLSPSLRLESFLVGFLLLVCGAIGAFILIREPRTALSFGLSSPPPFQYKTHPTPPGPKWGTLSTPFATNAWWTNLALDGEVAPSAVTPYAVRAVSTNAGDSVLEISYGAKRLAVTKTSVVEAFAPDASLGTAGPANISILHADALTLGLQLSPGVIARLARGSPYITVEYEANVVTVALPLARVASLVADAWDPADEAGDKSAKKGKPSSKGSSSSNKPGRTNKKKKEGFLDDDFFVDDDKTTTADEKATTTTGVGSNNKACSAYAGCAKLIGDCCPTPAGVRLGCCGADTDGTEARRRLGQQQQQQQQHGPSAKTVGGHRFTLTALDGSTWRVYASHRIEFAVVAGEEAVTSTATYSGVVRVAYLPAGPRDSFGTVAVLDAHSGRYAVGVAVRWTSEFHEAVYRFAWKTEAFLKDHALLQLCLPHHRATMATLGGGGQRIFVSDSPWRSLKGELSAVVGDEWALEEALTTIAWEAPRPPRADVVREDVLLRQIQRDAAAIEETSADFEAAYAKSVGVYTAGKRAAQFATLALAASAAGSGISAKKAARAAARAITPWLAHNTLLAYDASYGGVVSRAGLADVHADFGNGYYNDHHFQYGYLIYAASVAIKLLGSINDLSAQGLGAIAADIANVAGRTMDKKNSLGRAARSHYFPVARHKDFFEGHSWASGLFELNDAKSQESVSEAAHAYYAVSLLGDATQDYELRDWGRLLFALEARAARMYWNARTYPAPFNTAAHVGVLGALDVSAHTWFGASAAYSVLINCLPFTAVTEDLLPGPDDLATVLDATRAAANDLPSSSDGGGAANHESSKKSPTPASPPVKAAAVNDLAAIPGNPADPATGPWLALTLQLLAVVDPKSAADQIIALKDDAALDLTQTKASMLYWASTRPEPLAGSLTEAPTPARPMVLEACSDNPGCDKLGLHKGLCCPTAAGVMLSCC